MAITEEDIETWEIELTEDLAACLAPLVGSADDLDPTEKANEDAIVCLQKKFKDTNTAMARIGKDCIKNMV